MVLVVGKSEVMAIVTMTVTSGKPYFSNLSKLAKTYAR
jgi:hypothetical protein